MIENKLILGLSITEDAMKKSHVISCLLASLCLSGAASLLHAEDVATSDLKLMTEGATMKIGSYSPLKLELSTDKPAALKKARISPPGRIMRRRRSTVLLTSGGARN